MVILSPEAVMPHRLQGKSIAITGGDQGIGRAIAERLAQDGADIALCYRSNQSGAQEVVAEIAKLGPFRLHPH
jgi:3-oxoacyl-[acyl-carrier protein] reductase